MAGKARWMKALWIPGLLLAGAVSLWLLVTDPGTLSGLLAIVLWSAVGVGIIVRLIRAPRGNIRKSFPTDPGDRPGRSA